MVKRLRGNAISEQAPQPQPDIFTEALGYDSFDGWLSGIADERLQQLADVISQVDAQELKNEGTLHHLIGVAMLFKGNQPMTTEEITQALVMLTSQVVVEIHVRNGVVTKQGEYSMTPDGTNALFTVTDKGREIFG